MSLVKSDNCDYTIISNEQGHTWFKESVMYPNQMSVHSHYTMYGATRYDEMYTRTMYIQKSLHGMKTSWELPSFWWIV